MAVRHGRKFLSIPGPTTVPDEVLSAMHRPAVDIYSGELLGVTERCLARLKDVFRTEGATYIYISNGHGAWEAALSNTLSRGDRALALESGHFAVNWVQMGEPLGLETEILPGDWRRAVDPEVLERRLRDDADGEIKAILVVQVDTASGAVNDIPAIRQAIDAAGHDALLMVDAIASLGTMPFEMDAWGVDLAVSGSQKGLMNPPGLGFIAAGPRAIEAHGTAGLRTRYWDWTMRDGPLHYQKFCGTPPEHMLFGLDRGLSMLLDEEGLEAAWERHRILADACDRAVAVWSRPGAIGFNILERAHRSPSVTTVLMPAERAPDGMKDSHALIDWCRDVCGVTIGVGIGELRDRAFRIAHMGHVNAPMLLGTLGVIEAGLQALDVPHGAGGVQAAIDRLAEAA